ncbi:MAG: hypothetical protein DMF79_10105 [Acidobacteria bacterium]|nr:MAG: hypothetical protein DMF79_10105 [Acidobacteriota bacterium]
MTTTTETTRARTAETADPTLLVRILEEGYGPGAWHGADMKAALADVSPEAAYWRPAPGRHNIAEIALHHAYCIRGVRGRLTGPALEPFVLEGDDWFPLDNETLLTLIEVLTDLAAGRVETPLQSAERFGLVLGATCHAVYHAGQIQLLKRLSAR